MRSNDDNTLSAADFAVSFVRDSGAYLLCGQST